jgi:hypothetical protein
MDSIVIIRIKVIIINIVFFENVFIVSFISFEKVVGSKTDTNNSSIIIILVLSFFVFSFEAIVVVYIKRVIIPEEKVKIIVKGSQLLVVFLYTMKALPMDKMRIKIARNIGLFIFIDFIVVKIIILDIFLYLFDLQNQCLKNLWEFLFVFFCFFFVVFCSSFIMFII